MGRDFFELSRSARWTPPLTALVLAAVVLAGIGLRLVWVEDIEFKIDEAWTFHETQAAGRTEPFPWRGMPSSTGLDNPGLSVWIFIGLGRLFAVHDPTQLARVVQCLSIAGILLLIAFIFICVPRAEREPWLWASALLWVNPLAVLFHRKIWPPSVLPVFISILLFAWWRRERRLGAFFWGLVGACLGQIHMGGFFFAAAFVAWALLFDRKRVAWASWCGGSLLGSLPLVPWLVYLLTEWGSQPLRHKGLRHIVEGKFWSRWLLEPLGFGLDHALRRDYFDFLTWPRIGNQPTYLVGLLQALALGAGLWIFVRALGNFWSKHRTAGPVASGVDHERAGRSETGFTLGAAFWGYGLLLTFSCLPVHRHYMVIVYPFELLWLARLALGSPASPPACLRTGRRLLAALCLCQALLAAAFLGYIHTHARLDGDYGVPYRAQPSAAHPQLLSPAEVSGHGRVQTVSETRAKKLLGHVATEAAVHAGNKPSTSKAWLSGESRAHKPSRSDCEDIDTHFLCSICRINAASSPHENAPRKLGALRTRPSRMQGREKSRPCSRFHFRHSASARRSPAKLCESLLDRSAMLAATNVIWRRYGPTSRHMRGCGPFP
jgi:hypothetical protein